MKLSATLVSLSLLAGSPTPLAAQTRGRTGPARPAPLQARSLPTLTGNPAAAPSGRLPSSLTLPASAAPLAALPRPGLADPAAAPDTVAAAAALESPAAFAERPASDAAAQPSTEEGRAAAGRIRTVIRAALPALAPRLAEDPSEAPVPSEPSGSSLRPAAPQASEAPVERALSYDPARPPEPLWKEAWRVLRHLPERLRRVRAFMRRADAMVEAVTDEQLRWSLYRLEALETQEGILRADNGALVNKWKHTAADAQELSPEDFEGASLSPVSLMKLFKSAMDLEEPTLQYQFAFSQTLHDRLPRMSHFLGTTLQERILQVALKGRPGQRAIWPTEEVRHGHVLERVYNATRAPSLPPLRQAGEAPRMPRQNTDYATHSGMSNRSLAELAAAAAYLALRANSAAGSPTEKVLDGIYRDEVYHYVIMSALNRFIFGHRSRWKRLYLIARHDLDFRPDFPNDMVRHYRRLMSPLAIFETLYALNAIDKRVERYLASLEPAEARRVIGPYYRTDAEIQAAVDRGEHNWTRHFVMEQNPEMTADDVRAQARRLPGMFSVDRRVLAASDIRAVIDNYRNTSLKNPRYWMRKKGFRPYAGAENVLERPLRDWPGALLRLEFGDARGPRASLASRNLEELPERIHWSAWLDDVSMRQIGVLMDAEGPQVLQDLERAIVDLEYQGIANKLGRSEAYQKEPLRVVD